MDRKGFTLLLALALGGATAAARAADEGEGEAPSAAGWALGDWGGTRSALAAHGLDAEFLITSDLLGVADGGVSRGFATPTRFDIGLKLDTATAGWWHGGSLQLSFMGTAGNSLSRRAGDMQVVSNVEGENTLIVYEANYEHRWLDNRVSLLVGLHDLNSEFYVLEHAGLFLNSSLGIGIEVAQVGTSIFPTTAPGARLQIKPTAETYAMAAIYDGRPGSSKSPFGTHVAFEHGDGLFGIAEAGLVGAKKHYYKLGLGGWYHTREFRDIAARTRDDNRGIYAIGEKDLWRAEDGRGVGVFGQLGFAPGDRNQIATYAGGGLTWTGAVPGREADVLGLAVAHARNGDRFRRLNPGSERAETTIEATYQIQPLPWLSLQPDVQYVVNPSTDSSIDNAFVVGLRVQVTL